MLSLSPLEKLLANIRAKFGLKSEFHILPEKNNTIEFVFQSSDEANQFNNWIFKDLAIGSVTNAGKMKTVQSSAGQFVIFFTKDQFQKIQDELSSTKAEENIDIKPNKVNPDDVDSPELNDLKEYLRYIQSSPAFDAKTREDATKIVKCMMFIKLNIPYLMYACTHKSDLSIYTHLEAKDGKESDVKKQVVRDFNDTAIHIHYKTQNKCRDEMECLVRQFEESIRTCKRFNKLITFTNKFIFDEEKGCIDARIGGSIEYALSVESSSIPQFTDIMKIALAEIGYDKITDEKIVYKKVYQYFSDNLLVGTKCIKQSYSDSAKKVVDSDIEISKEEIDAYLESLGNQKNTDVPFPKSGKTAKQVFEVIKKEEALIKVIGSTLGDNVNWDFILNRLADPENNRSMKDHPATFDRNNIFNPATGKWETRVANPVRGGRKSTPYIKKTSMTLIPHDGVMKFFNSTDIGLIFDIKKCQIKDKYIFSTNASTNSRWWIKGYTGECQLIRSTTLKAIREKNRTARKNKEIPKHNEFLGSPQRSALVGILVQNENLDTVLNAIARKRHVQRILGIDQLPILILQEPYFPLNLTEEIQIDKIIQGYRQVSNALKYIENGFFSKQIFDIMSDTQAEDLLFHALKNKNEALAKMILRKKPTTKGILFDWETGQTCLHFAVLHGLLYIAKTLIARQDIDDLNRTDLDDNTPINLALNRKQIVMYRFLRNESNFIEFTSDEFFTKLLLQLCKLQQFDDAYDALLRKPSFECIESQTPIMTPLHYAAESGQISLVKKLCEYNYSFLGAENADGKTALDLAINNSHLEIIEILLTEKPHQLNTAQINRAILSLAKLGHFSLAARAMANERTELMVDVETKNTALHFALLAGDEDFFEKFFDRFKQTITLQNKDNKDLLDVAIDKNNIPALTIMINNSIALIPHDRLLRLITQLLSIKNTDLVSYILSNRKDLMELNNEVSRLNVFSIFQLGKPKLACKYLYNHCKYLDERATDKNNRNFTLLHYASELGYTRLAEKCLKFNADVTSTTTDKMTPLEVAALNARDEICRLLISHDSINNLSASQISGLLANFIASGKDAFCELLVDNYRNIEKALEISIPSIATPLHYAVGTANTELVKKLSRVSDLSMTDSNGLTAIEKSSLNKSYQHIQSIIENANHTLKNLDPNSIGKLAFQLSRLKLLNLVTLLLNNYDKEITIYCDPSTKENILHYAASEGNVDCVTAICKVLPTLPATLSNTDNQNHISRAVSKHQWAIAIVMYQYSYKNLPTLYKIDIFDLLCANSRPPLTMLKFVPGVDGLDRRARGHRFIMDHINNAKTISEINNIISYLNDNLDDLLFISGRIRNLGLSLHMHTYNKKEVSSTWIKIMKAAEFKQAELKWTQEVVVIDPSQSKCTSSAMKNRSPRMNQT